MAALLHLDSSANRSSESVSRQLTALFAGTWQAIHGSAGCRYRDLTADPVPPLSTAYCVLGRRVERHGLVPPDGVAGLAKSPAEQQEWALTSLLITEIAGGRDSADWCPDVQLLGTRRAQGLDRPGELPRAFIDPHTGQSLLRDTKVVVIVARGGAYGAGGPREVGISRRHICGPTSASTA